jgi:type I restriction enzyme S subunit
VQTHGKGIVLRDEVYGSEIKTKKQQAACTGEFLVAEIDAKVGGFGIVPPELDSAVVSSHYFLFRINEQKCSKEWLNWFVRYNSLEEQVKAEGSTNYAAIRPRDVLAYQIPLPPLAEQHRIVERIEALAARVNEAQLLRADATQETKSIVSSTAFNIFSQIKKTYPTKTFGSFLPHVTSGPRYWRDRYSKDGFRFYRAQDIGPHGNIFHDSKAYVTPPESDQGKTALLSVGDLMIVITGATVGRVSVFTDDLEPGYVSQHVSICRLPQDQILPRYALWWLLSPDGQSQLLGQRYGQGKPGLNLTNIRSIEIPVPPLGEQRRIVAYLDGLQAKVSALRALQSETQKELDALLPSILDKAFKGEL